MLFELDNVSILSKQVGPPPSRGMFESPECGLTTADLFSLILFGLANKLGQMRHHRGPTEL